MKCLKSVVGGSWERKGLHHLVPLHLNLFVKLSIILSTGGYLLMIDAAPLNVMDESAATRWDEGESPGPGFPSPLLRHPLATLPCKGDACLVSIAAGKNKATFNLSPINNVQLRGPIAEGVLL